uniref:Centrosomal protein of 44 kDa n=1 Tax=Terrapene triunguis TaxID=2587831 RepID=A0A674IH47_9SAUR
MATGDLKGSLRKLEQGLRLLNYARDVDYTGFVKGDPAAFLPIISYSFTSFSTYIAELLVESDVELTAKSDLRFIEAIYKLLRDQFQYKPVLTKQQFLQCGFAERKIQIVCDVISAVMKKHKELKALADAFPRAEFPSPAAEQEFCRAEALNPGRHWGRKNVPHFCSGVYHVCSIVFMPKIRENKISYCSYFQATEDNSQIELLKSQLADCQEKLHKLNSMEDKLHVLEERLKGKVIIDEKDWNNLLSRVLLLETELLLQSKKSYEHQSYELTSQPHSSFGTRSTQSGSTHPFTPPHNPSPPKKASTVQYCARRKQQK